MGNETGNLARSLAAAPLHPEGEAIEQSTVNGKPQPDTDKKVSKRDKENPLIAMLGKPTIVVGKNVEYPAKEYGVNGKVIPNKWNTPLAMAVWTLGGHFKLSANITKTREIVQTERGREEIEYVDMAFPKALSYDRKLPAAVAQAEGFKAFVMDCYDKWAETPDGKKAVEGTTKAKTGRISGTARVTRKVLPPAETPTAQ